MGSTREGPAQATDTVARASLEAFGGFLTLGLQC